MAERVNCKEKARCTDGKVGCEKKVMVEGGEQEEESSWRAVRKLAEVGLLTARKSVGVPETRGGGAAGMIGGGALFRGLCQESYYFALRWWHVGGKQGPRKLVAWVDIDVFSSVKVRGRCWRPWRAAATFWQGKQACVCVGRMRLRRRARRINREVVKLTMTAGLLTKKIELTSRMNWCCCCWWWWCCNWV